MKPDMKKIGRQISLRMGITLSICLSIIGNVYGQFSSKNGFQLVPFIIGLILSCIVSIIISLFIGFVVPVRKITENFCSKHNLKPGKFKTLLAESLISDLIYTPIITVIMVCMNYAMAYSRGNVIPVIGMVAGLIGSLLLCFVAGYVLILIFMPMYIKLVLEKNGVQRGE